MCKARAVSHPFIAVAVVALGALGGCGDDSSSSSCTLTAQVSGAVDWQNSENPACLAPFSGSSGISMYFKPLGADVTSFVVEVRDVMAGQTGSFPAGVGIELRDGRSFSTATTACTVRIDEQVFELEDQFRKQYLASGSGSCTSAAMPKSGTTGTVSVAPFSFRFPANY